MILVLRQHVQLSVGTARFQLYADKTTGSIGPECHIDIDTFILHVMYIQALFDNFMRNIKNIFVNHQHN